MLHVLYVVANNLILEHFTDLNIYRQEDLECVQMNQSWLQSKLKLRKHQFWRQNSLNWFNWIYFSESVLNTKEHWCLIWHVMFPTWWIHLGFNLCKMCFHSAKHQHPFNMHIWCNLTLLLGRLSLWCKLQSGCRATLALQTLSNQRWCWEGWGSSRHGLDFKLLSMRNLPLCLLILAVLSCCVTRTALTCHNMFDEMGAPVPGSRWS